MVPGTIVERTKIILFVFVLTSLTSYKTLSNIVKSFSPSVLAGVGTDIKIKSESLTVSFIE